MVTIPEKVSALIAACQGRIRRILFTRGIVETGAVFLATVVAVMSVDAFTVIFSETARYAMTAGIYVLTALVGALTLGWRLRRRTTDRHLAEILDHRHPEHEECLSTLVEIAERSKEGRSNLSPALVSVLAARCSIAAGKLDPKREFTNRRVRWCFFALLALFATLVAALVTMPNLAGRLFVRAVLPWVDVGNLYEDDLKVSPGDIVALVGTEIRIEATADESLHSKPWIRISRREGKLWGEEFAEPLKDGVYTVIADLSEREWRYRISAGPAVSKFYTVRVCEMPRCRSFTAEVTYPAYTGKPKATLSKDALKNITAIEGTKVKFLPVPERNDTKCFFLIGMTARTDYTMITNRTDKWTLDLESAEGFRAPPQTGTLRSFRDKPPTIVVENPKERLLQLPSYSSFPIQLSASDDIGLKRVVIRYAIDGGEKQVLREVELKGKEKGQDEGEQWSANSEVEREAKGQDEGEQWRANSEVGGESVKEDDHHRSPSPSTFASSPNAPVKFLKSEQTIDLSLIGDALTRNVEFDLVAEDGRGEDFGGAQAATSTPFTVTFEVRAQNWEMQDLGREMKEVQSLIHEAEKRIDAVQNPVNEAKSALERENAVSEQTEKKIEHALHEAQESLERLEDINEILEKDGRFEPVRELVEEQEERLKPIVEKLEAAQFDEAEERAKVLEEVQPEIKTARNEMCALEKPLKERKEEVETYEQTRDLAVRQEALAKAAEAILNERPVDTKKLDVWRDMEKAAVEAAKKLEQKLGAVQAPDEARRKMEKSAQLMDELKREIQFDEREAKEKNEKNAEKIESERKQFRKAGASSRESHLKEAERIAKRVEDQLANAERQLANMANAPQNVENALRAALSEQKQAADRLEYAEAEKRTDAAAESAMEKVRASLDTAEKAKTAREQAAKKKTADEQAIRNAQAEEAKAKTKAEGEAAKAKAAAEALAKAEQKLASTPKDADAATRRANEQEAAKAKVAAEKAKTKADEARAAAAKALASVEAAKKAAEEEAKAKGEGEQKTLKSLTEQIAAAKAAEAALKEQIASEIVARKAEAEAAVAAEKAEKAAAEAAKALAAAEAAKKAAEEAKAAKGKNGKKIGGENRGTKEGDSVAGEEKKAKVEGVGEKAKVEGEGEQSKDRSVDAESSPRQKKTPSADGRATAADKAEEAAEAMRDAAREKAEAMGIKPPEFGKGEPKDSADKESKGSGSSDKRDSSDSPSAGGIMKEINDKAKELKEKDPDLLKPVNVKAGWFRIRGAAKGRLGDRDLKGVPPEYRDLVRAYFLKLSE